MTFQEAITTVLFYKSFVLYYSFVKESRLFSLAFFSIIATRMISETASCPTTVVQECANGLVILVPFILSSHFVDSSISDYLFSPGEKKITPKLLLALPYFVFVVYVVLEFVASLSVVTIEYIISINLLYSMLIYTLIYWLNNKKGVRRLNSAMMVTFIISLIIFQFI